MHLPVMKGRMAVQASLPCFLVLLYFWVL